MKQQKLQLPSSGFEFMSQQKFGQNPYSNL